MGTVWHFLQDTNITAPESDLRDTRSALEEELTSALAGRKTYDDRFARFHLNHLQWRPHPSILVEPPPPYVVPPYIRYTLNDHTFWVVPEMVPVGEKWLDTLCPSFRTFDVVTAIEDDPRPRNVAIIFMEDDRELEFELWASHAERRLRESGVAVDLFPGGELAIRGAQRYQKLAHILSHYRAVLFYGHLIADDDGNGGWALTPHIPLKMQDLRAVLGTAVEHGKVKRNRVPELVFAACCSGAGQDPERYGWRGLPYPRVFLEGGVNFFIGAWMDVIGARPDSLREDVVGLSTDFFSAWSPQPDHTIYHLYDVKKARGFPLLGSLFHVYCPANYVPPLRDVEPVEEPATTTTVRREAPEPAGSFMSAVEKQSRLGDYVLNRRLWSTPFSKTFWGTSAEGNHLVEILSDEWQGSASIAQQIRTSVEPLQRAGLDEGHLVPARIDFCPIGEEEPRQRMLALVYDRPADETLEAWSMWEDVVSVPGGSRFSDVLEAGAELGLRIAALHENNLRHGNLSPANVVIRTIAGKRQVVLKDAWLWAHRPDRRIDTRYTPPEERLAPANAAELKGDCWAIGAILYAAATGLSPEIDSTASQTIPSIREVLRSEGALVPDALEQIVRECLIPLPVLRPRALDLAFRLHIGSIYGHEYRGDFEERLFRGLAVGERLFGIRIEDRRELEPTLAALEERGHAVFVFEPDVGIIQRATGRVTAPWMSQREIRSIVARGDPNPPQFDSDLVLAINARILLSTAIDTLRHIQGPVPVIVVFGGLIWNASPPEQRIAMRRILKNCEYEYGAPAVIFADPAIALAADEELTTAFHWLHYPPLSPADLFDRVVSAPQSEKLDVPPVTVAQAMAVSARLHPIHSRELSYVLRLAALEFGAIDERAAAVLDLGREEAFRKTGGVTYLPLARLPAAEQVGLPAPARARAMQWAELVSAASEAAVPPPVVIGVEGPTGYGKTTTALLLGTLTCRPVIRIDIASCFGRNLGQSEETLRAALQLALVIPGVIVLLDNIDHFITSVPEQANDTVRRIDTTFLRWLDDIPPYAAAVLTMNRIEDLPVQWQRRIELRLSLDDPVGLADGASSNAYRAAVFGAILHKCGLAAGDDEPWVVELAERTNPARMPPLLLHSPLALHEAGASLKNIKVTLDSGAAIEQWIHDVLQYHAADGDPQTAAFWLDKLR